MTDLFHELVDEKAMFLRFAVPHVVFVRLVCAALSTSAFFNPSMLTFHLQEKNYLFIFRCCELRLF